MEASLCSYEYFMSILLTNNTSNPSWESLLHSDSANLKTEKADKTHIPRENMSLPSNMQLHDLSTLRKGEKPKTPSSHTQMAGAVGGDRRRTIHRFSSNSQKQIINCAPQKLSLQTISCAFCCVLHPSCITSCSPRGRPAEQCGREEERGRGGGRSVFSLRRQRSGKYTLILLHFSLFIL